MCSQRNEYFKKIVFFFTKLYEEQQSKDDAVSVLRQAVAGKDS